MTAGCLTPPERGFGAAGVEASSAANFCFFARLGGGFCVVLGILSGLAPRSIGAFRLRDLGGAWGWTVVDVEAEAVD